MTAQPTEVSTEDLAARRGDAEGAVVDVRPLAAYNGWRLRGEPRGGHIPGATSLPARWRRDADPATLLRGKGISPDRPLTLYGYDEAALERTAASLARSDFETPSVYTAFLDEWVPDADRPLESLDRHRRLVPPEWVRGLTRGGTPPSGPEGEYVLCHVHVNDRADYRAGHVPGAIPLAIQRLEAPADWNRRSPADLAAALAGHGVAHDTTVVLYGRPAAPGNDDAAPGQMGAMRCATILLYAGVDDVRILNGGLAAWEAAGLDLTTEPTRPERVESFGTDVPARPELFIDTPEAKAWLAAEDRDLVSVRSHDELAAETGGYEYVSRSGRIPGAIPAPSGSGPRHVEEYRNPDGTMRPSQRVADAWAERGVDPDGRVAFYCGTGWRASEAFMHAYLMGWTGIAVYDGGWYEWSADSGNPIERGEPARDGPDR